MSHPTIAELAAKAGEGHPTRESMWKCPVCLAHADLFAFSCGHAACGACCAQLRTPACYACRQDARWCLRLRCLR